MSPQAHVLVTGLHRSGTTLFGQLLRESKTRHLLYEPFHPHSPPGIPLCRRQSQFYVTPRDFSTTNHVAGFNSVLERILIGHCWGSASRWWSVRDQLSVLKKVASLRSAIQEHRSLIFKCPELFFMTPFFLSQRPDFKCLVLTRHPLRLVASCKRMGWGFDRDSLIQLAEIIEPDTDEWRKGLDGRNPMVSHNACLWNLSAILLQRIAAASGEQLRILRFKDFVVSPFEVLSDVFAWLGETPPEVAVAKIRSMHMGSGESLPESSAANPEQHRLERNLGSAQSEWKKILTLDEVNLIGEICAPFESSLFADGV